MLKVGIIGYGGRVRGLAGGLNDFGIPVQIAAVADPRWEQLKAECEELSETRMYPDADALLGAHQAGGEGRLDGIMIGTRCSLHAPLACQVAPTNLPLFLEKPIAITYEQVRDLQRAFADYTSEAVISFPLRLTSVAQAAKEVVDSGRLGPIDHIQAWNNVPYGDVYFGGWYRDTEETGGMFLQKATHDFDYLSYIVGQRPRWVAAMKSQRVYGGDKPDDLRCDDCDEQETCMESPFNRFYLRCLTPRVSPSGTGRYSDHLCMFAQSNHNEDSGNALVEFENGMQASYTQNFFARNGAGARGARFFGYHGMVEFDWYTESGWAHTAELKVRMHHSPRVDIVRFESSALSHGGGDRELIYDFLRLMQGRGHSRSPLEAGIVSVLTCLAARESAETRRFVEVVI